MTFNHFTLNVSEEAVTGPLKPESTLSRTGTKLEE